MRRLAVALAALALALPAATARASSSFIPNDPLAPRQWYLTADHAFDVWPAPPALSPVLVAVVDSGIDGRHPEFAGRIAVARSFVGGSPLTDEQGHGTFVAGEIAAATGNGIGIAGIALSAKLIIAKVVRGDRAIPLHSEAAAIRWAVAEGARVINLSLGGLRDPTNSARDTYSPLEARAVAYAVSHGVLVVAAVGNGDQAPHSPWPYASYPAALPHVLGVSAYAADGSIPPFSNRDAVFDDVVAPGQDMLSTLPRRLTAERPSCPDQGYSDCGPDAFDHASGTSFSTPQVSAAAALLLASDPTLRPDQLSALLERTADDANTTNGCRSCALLRDSLTGWGRLDVANALGALAGPLPPADRYETNDDAGSQAVTVWGQTIRLAATIDYWDDPVDVYRVRAKARQRLTLTLRGPGRATTGLSLWKPGTRTIVGSGQAALRGRIAAASGPGALKTISYRARIGGWYFVEAKLVSPGFGPYTLSIVKR